jgi:hypothetical protein
VRDAEGFTPDEVLDFLLHLLKQNDNTGNPYSDYSYLATVIEALGELATFHPHRTVRLELRAPALTPQSYR